MWGFPVAVQTFLQILESSSLQEACIRGPLMLDSLAADRALVAALNAKILDLENMISALRLEQAQVQSRLDSYKYPVLTLPNEIISQIFTHFPPPYPSCPPLTGTLSPTSLTHICRQWREIALSLPSLWRAMNLSHNGISLEEEEEEQEEDLLLQRDHMANLWLTRSRSCPLSIEFDAQDEDDYDLNHDILNVLAPHCTRLEHLKLVLFLRDLPFIEDIMPLLRSLDLEILGDRTTHSLIIPVPLYHHSLLRSVRLNDIATMRVISPWAQLTSLALYDMFIRECVPILQQTSNLIYCELDLRHSVNRGSEITLPRLESLVLKGQDLDAGPFLGYLESFITPAIRHLRISEQFLGNEPIHSLTKFISKSGCKLQEVCITDKDSSVSTVLYRDALQTISRLSFIPVEDLESNSDSDSSHITNTDPGELEDRTAFPQSD
ncbi:hypothetical protein B0H12DRAFT_43580 [Mycena haematopus]|nr:hypothetical protein B0H12DRAFT_43580 [Mycena haematopus]